MSYGGAGYGSAAGGFGAGAGASTDVGMSSEAGMSQAVPEQGSGAEPAKGGKPPMFETSKGGGGSTTFEKPDLPNRDLGGMREGFRRLDEVGARQRTYGTP